MTIEFLITALTAYGILLVLLSFHEFAHAWVALMCGDSTARDLGRVSINPIVHMDLTGTVILPLAMMLLGSQINGFPILFGWAKPVPVNPRRLGNQTRDSVLVAMAGPAMNLLLAAAFLPLAHFQAFAQIAVLATQLSLVLCFFNLIPVPPLDGSHLLKALTGMSDQTFARMAPAGFIVLIVLLQVPLFSNALYGTVSFTFRFLASLYHLA